LGTGFESEKIDMELRAFLKQELRLWLQYSAITLIAAIWTYDYLFHKYAQPDYDINPVGYYGKMCSNLLFPLFGIYAGLSILRICILLFARKIGGRGHT